MATKRTYVYEVRLHPDCRTGTAAPLISRHTTLHHAVAKARQSDQWQVELRSSIESVWAPPERGDNQGRSGRYGRGPQPGEPTVDQILRQLEAQEAQQW